MRHAESGSTVRCLIVDADSSSGGALQSLLGERSSEAFLVSNLDEARQLAAGYIPDLIFFRADHLPPQLTPEELRVGFPSSAILIAVVADSAPPMALLTAGVDIVIHEPLGRADIKRVINLIAQLGAETGQVDRQRHRGLSAIRQFAFESLNVDEQAAILPTLLEIGRSILDLRAVAAWEIDSTEDKLRVLASAGLPLDYIANLEERSRGRSGAVAQSVLYDQFDYVDLSDTSGRYALPMDPQAAAAAGLARSIWLPIRDRSRLYGLLSIYLGIDQDEHQVDPVLVEALTTTAATFLATARLRRELTVNERLYRELVERLPIGMVVCDQEGHIRLVNHAFVMLTGASEGGLVGRNVRDVFVAPGAVPWDEWIRFDEGHESNPKLLELAAVDGRKLIVECRGRAITLPDVSREGLSERRIQITLDDVTAAQRRLYYLELLHDLTRLVSGKMNPTIAFEMVAQRLARDLGYRIVEIAMIDEEGTRLIAQSRVGAMDDSAGDKWDINQGIIGRALRENRAILAPDVSQEPENLDYHADVVGEVVAVIKAEGAPIGVLNIAVDATRRLDDDDLAMAESIAAHLGLLLEQAALTDELARQAMTDPLLGCANRRVLMERLHSVLADRRVESAALLFIDLDDFKQINDQYGHLRADDLLTQVARRLSENLRGDDLLARYAGDELAVLLQSIEPEYVTEVADRLYRSITDTPFALPDGVSVNLSASIGIARYPEDGDTPDQLITVADRAMYQAKSEGRRSRRGLAAG